MIVRFFKSIIKKIVGVEIVGVNIKIYDVSSPDPVMINRKLLSILIENAGYHVDWLSEQIPADDEKTWCVDRSVTEARNLLTTTIT